ncbi:helix-turn-helix transcriptional regulator [Mesorhizobium sp. BAC0120]|uniref:helix-turn-helix transcriptional regulator n=1 Tax=Mesorhizobium sp. BAC0120 TaxID=3090670 RepID=UPI00298CD45C|nr:helix-turn-helix transcriptional regulator [Mesorhizobium sp. BAC0120]MDW6023334.1 helix-turn-helix transcriptional regulator [Mesorhizobium sp. BAC0120]
MIGAAEAIDFANRLFTTVRLEEYPGKLIQALQELAPFEIYTVTIFIPNRAPLLLYGNLDEFVPPRVIENFLTGTYLLDAVYSACCAGVKPGLFRLSELAPDDYFSSDFYNSADFHPCVSDEKGSLAEEIVYMARPAEDLYLVLSLMRTKRVSPFDDAEFGNLKVVAPVVLETMSSHWQSHVSQARQSDVEPPASTLDKAFATFAKDKLSPREQTIVSLLLRGHSTLSVAHNLDIAEGTAKVHRRNIYEKLGISSQAQMFLMFCSHIIDSQEPLSARNIHSDQRMSPDRGTGSGQRHA